MNLRMFLFIVFLLFIFCNGCESLSQKSVAVATRADALKIDASGSVSSQSIAPSIMIGGGATCLSTSRAFSDGEKAVPTFSYSRQTSFFGSLFGLDIGSETMTYTGNVDESSSETRIRIMSIKNIVDSDFKTN